MTRRSRPDGTDLEPLVRELRGSLANLRAASEALDLLAPPGESAEARDLRAVVLDEAARLSGAVDRLGTALLPFERPAGKRLSVRDLVTELARGARADLDLPVDLGEAPADIRLADGATLVAALLGALGRLRRDYAVSRVAFRTRLHQGLVAMDLSWPATEPEIWRLRESLTELLAGGWRGESPLREVVEAMGGEVWLTVDRAAESASLRLLLPPA
ncbi:MAG TPA: hypothetical protein VLT87_12940 [Thermoanaerobaculia bacterium]|nr:hypothetical protein [Thermoanaerobaculia bacterium]